MSSTSFDEFLSIQSTWKSEIQERFLKFKREESVSQKSLSLSVSYTVCVICVCVVTVWSFISLTVSF